jgi:hypothetical protein
MRVDYRKLSRYVPAAATVGVVVMVLALGVFEPLPETRQSHTVARAAIRLAGSAGGRLTDRFAQRAAGAGEFEPVAIRRAVAG